MIRNFRWKCVFKLDLLMLLLMLVLSRVYISKIIWWLESCMAVSEIPYETAEVSFLSFFIFPWKNSLSIYLEISRLDAT